MPEHIETGPCGCWACIQETEARSSIRDSARLLCEDHQVLLQDESGDRLATEEALLIQLVKAKTPSGEGGGSSGAAAGAPLDLAALDLERLIQHQGNTWLSWAQAGAQERQSLTLLVQLVVARAAELSWAAGEEGTLINQISLLMGEWVTRIRDLLDPPRRTPLDAACPVCGARERVVEGEDGETSRSSALVAMWSGHRVDHVLCRLCTSFWPRAGFVDLAVRLDPGLLARLTQQEASVIR